MNLTGENVNEKSQLCNSLCSILTNKHANHAANHATMVVKTQIFKIEMSHGINGNLG